MTLLLLSSLVFADVAPPETYVETCTIAIQCGPDIEGQSCSAMYDDRSACEALEAQGWFKMCSTWGASAWDEVFCAEQPDAAELQARIDAAEGAGSSDDKEDKGCATVTAAPALAPLLALALLLFGARRKQGTSDPA